MDVVSAIAVAVLAFAAGVGGGWVIARSRNQAKSGLARNEQLLELLAAHTPIALMVYTSVGDIVYANRYAQELFFEGETLQGLNFLTLLRDADPPLREALLSPDDSLFTLVKDGANETFQLLRRTIAVHDTPHDLLLVNHLTREVSRREVDLLKKVIRVISHELNNSLATISSLLNSGRFISQNPEHLADLARVFDGLEERVQHLTFFLSEYASLARMPRPRPKETPWEPMLSQLDSLLPEIELPDPPAEPGWFDRTQVEQMLINLIKNAREAGSPAEDIEVRIERHETAFEIRVLDRGSGFSKEALQHGLLPFYSTKEGGNGVGLALCREVTEGHGGVLRIRAREGGGAAIGCTLPLRKTNNLPMTSNALSLTRTRT